MNILFLDQFSDLGGAQRCLLDLLPAVRDHGWSAHLAAPGSGSLREHALALGASYDEIHSGPYESGRKSIPDLARFGKQFPRLAGEITELARACQADIVYVNGPRLLPSVYLALQRRLCIVFHCHSYLGQRYAAALAGVALAGSKATMIASCRFVSEPLRPYVSEKNIRVVYNGVGGTVCPARHPLVPQSPWRIGIVGRIAPEKGQLEFVKAARLLGSNYQFVICGEPLFSNAEAADYYGLVRELSAGLPIEFLGWREDVDVVLSNLDLLVAPSVQREATTRVILEAYAAGVPVLASNSGGIAEIVSDGETGFLASANDPATLAESIRRALAEPGTLQTIANNAHRAWREKYTLEHYQEQIVNILEGLVQSGQEAPAVFDWIW